MITMTDLNGTRRKLLTNLRKTKQMLLMYRALILSTWVELFYEVENI